MAEWTPVTAPALTSPINGDGSVDYAALQQNIQTIGNVSMVNNSMHTALMSADASDRTAQATGMGIVTKTDAAISGIQTSSSAAVASEGISSNKSAMSTVMQS